MPCKDRMARVFPSDLRCGGIRRQSSCMIETPTRHSNSQSSPVTGFHLWAMGIVTVIGGQYYGWNVAFKSGFGYFAIGQVLMGAAFICYVCCVAEIIATIAFSGGAYGLSRVVLGFYPGFLVGCLEVVNFTSMTSVSVLYIADIVISYAGWSENFQPLVWWVVYAFMLLICTRKRVLLRAMLVLAVTSSLPIVIYFLASLKWTNFSKYASLHNSPAPLSPSNWFVGGVGTGFMVNLPYTTWAYCGIESMALMTSMTVEPKLTFMRGVIPSVLTLFVSNICLMFVVPSMPPGILSSAELAYPLNLVFDLAFGWSEQLSIIIQLPAQLGMAMGFLIPYGKLMQSLADSNLIPAALGLRRQRSLMKAMVLGSVLGYIFCLGKIFFPVFDTALQNMSILAATLTYFAQLTGFIMLRTKFDNLPREYRSPFGLVGAVYAGIVFLLLSISIVGFQPCLSFSCLALYLLVCSCYYFGLGKSRQTISEEEYHSLFKLEVITHNLRKRNMSTGAKKRNLRASPSRTTGSVSPIVQSKGRSESQEQTSRSETISKAMVKGDHQPKPLQDWVVSEFVDEVVV